VFLLSSRERRARSRERIGAVDAVGDGFVVSHVSAERAHAGEIKSHDVARLLGPRAKERSELDERASRLWFSTELVRVETHDERGEFTREFDFLTGDEPRGEMVEDAVDVLEGEDEDGLFELARANLGDGVQSVRRRLLTQQQRIGLDGSDFTAGFGGVRGVFGETLGLVIGEVERLGDGVRRSQRLERLSSSHASLALGGEFGVGTNTLVDLFVEHGFESTLLFFVDKELFVGSFPQAQRTIAAPGDDEIALLTNR